MIRTFVAIELPAPLRSRITQMAAELAPCRIKVKWVERENMHLTLKFLGDVQENLIPDIGSALKQAIAGVGAFRAEVAGVGAFPHVGRPNTIWVGIGRGQTELVDLHGHIDRCLAPLGVARDGRRYTPHITVGRVRSGRDMKRLSTMLRERADEHFGETSVSGITLFSSQLSSAGSIYTALEHISLKGA